MTRPLSDAALDELAPPESTFTVETCRWPGGLSWVEYVILRCRCGREAVGLVARGSGRRTRRELVGYLRGRHAREHGCCR